MWQRERTYWAQGLRVAGLDEAGRGCLAGPVVAGPLFFQKISMFPGLNDSKQLSASEREALRRRIDREAMAVGIGMADVEYIDTHNILQATFEAMRRAVASLPVSPGCALGGRFDRSRPDPSPTGDYYKGDSHSHSIAAASIVAKTERDRWMRRRSPAAIPSTVSIKTRDTRRRIIWLRWIDGDIPPYHRRSFAPVRERLQGIAFSGAVDGVIPLSGKQDPRRSTGRIGEALGPPLSRVRGWEILDANWRVRSG